MTLAVNTARPLAREGDPLPYENPRSEAELEANRRAWLAAHPHLLTTVAAVIGLLGVGFAILGGVGAIDTISASAQRHGFTEGASWTPFAGAEGLFILLTCWRIFCGLRRRPAGMIARLGTWLAALLAVSLNVAPSVLAGGHFTLAGVDWVGLVYHLAIPAATIISVEILERVITATIAIKLGAEQYAAQREEDARVLRADRWLMRSARWSRRKLTKPGAVITRSVARYHEERSIAPTEERVAAARARLAAFVAADAVLPEYAAVPLPAGQPEAVEEQQVEPTPETITVERADRAAEHSLDDHLADALELLAGDSALDANGHGPLYVEAPAAGAERPAIAPAAAPQPAPVDLVKTAANAAPSAPEQPAPAVEEPLADADGPTPAEPTAAPVANANDPANGPTNEHPAAPEQPAPAVEEPLADAEEPDTDPAESDAATPEAEVVEGDVEEPPTCDGTVPDGEPEADGDDQAPDDLDRLLDAITPDVARPNGAEQQEPQSVPPAAEQQPDPLADRAGTTVAARATKRPATTARVGGVTAARAETARRSLDPVRAEADKAAARAWLIKNPGASASEVGRTFGYGKTWGHDRQKEVQQEQGANGVTDAPPDGPGATP
ncbi:hypothetical protein ABZW10_32960 [Kitasatospora sp. NPDC004723]|uniref:hypothetical protein n=1 Tax=Kitasatospora sp. NPDC004723 TaxID=3154288 RepID=UPI0033AAFBC4